MNIDSSTRAMITGAGTGIGRSLAIALGERGASVALVGRRQKELQETAAMVAEHGGQGEIVQRDISLPGDAAAAVAATITAFGGIDLLINNAGRGHLAYIDDTTPEQLQSIFAVNVFSLWYTSAPAIRAMKGQGYGAIVNIASIAGKIGFPANAAYVAAKHATIGFTRALRAELSGTGVSAMVAIPAGVATRWATSAEGGSMLELFAYEGERGVAIAQEKGISAAVLPSLLDPESVARRILVGIVNDEPEIMTHEGSRELIDFYHAHQVEVEHQLSPFWQANQEWYSQHKR